jgi:hypothetical protein
VVGLGLGHDDLCLCVSVVGWVGSAVEDVSVDGRWLMVWLTEPDVRVCSNPSRYCQNVFNDKHLTTLQASFLKKRLNIGGKRVDLAIWVSGPERPGTLSPTHPLTPSPYLGPLPPHTLLSVNLRRSAPPS